MMIEQESGGEGGGVGANGAEWWALNERQAQFCSVFGSALRIGIMRELEGGERTVGELAERLGTSMANLSQHLKMMRDRRCLLARRDGRHIYYRVGSPLFLAGMKLVRQGIREMDEAGAAVHG